MIHRYHTKYHTGGFDECRTCADIIHYASWAQENITREVDESVGRNVKRPHNHRGE